MELAEVCLAWPGFPCEGPAATAATAAALAKSAFSFRDIFHVSISSSSMGEMPLAKRGNLLLRYFRHISTPPATNRTPTTESTVLRVIMRVRLLPRPDASWLEEAEVSAVDVEMFVMPSVRVVGEGAVDGMAVVISETRVS